MDFLEKDLEDIIFDVSRTKKGRELLRERGLEIKGKLMRQVRLDSYGVADLVSIRMQSGRFGKTAWITIYELKKELIDVNSLMQSCKYATAIRRLYEKKLEIDDLDIEISVCLIGRKIQLEGDFVLLYNMIDSVCDIYTYSYDIDGLHFDYQDSSFYMSKENLDNIKIDFSVSDIKEMYGFIK